MPPESITRPARRHDDPLALLCVYGLLDLMLFISVDSLIAQSIVIPIMLLQARSVYRCLLAARYVHNERRTPIPNTLRFAIMKRDRYRCRLCGRAAANGRTLEIDHKTPITRGGTNDPANLWTLCTICNSGKSDSYL